MDKKRITIKDIAAEAGVSIGSVHYALSGKPGVGKETRDKILAIAHKYNYVPNTVASSLKRKTLHIAAAIPALDAEDKFFFGDIWQGVNDYLSEMKDFNIELIPVPFYSADATSHNTELHTLLETQSIDGLVSVGYTPTDGLVSLNEYRERNIPFVIAGSDIPHSGRLCCVRPDYHVAGSLMAEVIARQIHSEKDVLVCAGSKRLAPHYETVDGFITYFKKHNLSNNIIKLYNDDEQPITVQNIQHQLQTHNFAAACTVNARDSVRFSKVLREIGKPDGLFCVATDVFDENKESLISGIFDNLIYNNPYRCAFLATKNLVQYLLDNQKIPNKDVIEVNSEVVFRSSVDQYNPVNYQLQM